jgi:hypothetical protein
MKAPPPTIAAPYATPFDTSSTNMTEKIKAHISHQAMYVSTPTMKLHVSQVFAKSADGYPFYSVVPSTLVDSFWFDTSKRDGTDSKLARERMFSLWATIFTSRQTIHPFS